MSATLKEQSGSHEVLAPKPPGTWKYTASYSDATGFLHMGARYYAASMERWISIDPINSPNDTHGWNRYFYSADDPVNYTDLAGAQCGGDVFHAIEGVEGAAWSGIATIASAIGLGSVVSAGGATAVIGGATLGLSVVGFGLGTLGLLAFTGYSIYQATHSC